MTNAQLKPALSQLFRDTAQAHHAAFAHVDGFVAVTRYYAERAIEHFGLPADGMHYVPMGVQVRPSSRDRPPHEGSFAIGYLARICPDKGLHTLAKAFALLRQAGRPRKH